MALRFNCRSLRDGFSNRLNPDAYQDRWHINTKLLINWHKTQCYCVYRNIPFNSWAGKRNKEEELQELSNLLQSLRWTIHNVALIKYYSSLQAEDRGETEAVSCPGVPGLQEPQVLPSSAGTRGQGGCRPDEGQIAVSVLCRDFAVLFLRKFRRHL